MWILRCSIVGLLPLIVAAGCPFAEGIKAPESATGAMGPSPSGPLLLANLRIFAVDAGVMTGPQDVLIEEGRIRAIGTPGTLGPAPAATTIDCTGKYAVPGLFDCHTHVSNLKPMGGEMLDQTLGRFVEKGITQLRDVGGPLAVLQPLRARIESGELRGPDIFYTGPMLEKSPLTWAQMNVGNPGFTVAVDSMAAADRIVPELIQGGARCMKVFSKFDRDVFAHLVDLARAASLPVVHDPGPPLFHQVPIDFSIDCGVGSIEHGKAPWPIVLVDSLAQEQDELTRAHAGSEQRMAFVAKAAGLGTASISPEKLQAVFDKMIAHGVYFCPTLEVFVQMAEESGQQQTSDPSSPMATILKGMEEVSRYFTRVATARGVKILVGQDGVSPEGTLAEMRHLRDCGVSPAEILKGATIYPAMFLNATDRYGAIAPGRVANIVVVDQDPLAAIENIEAVFMVLQNGRVVPREGSGPEG
jgi:imidazolonepropionase-like amidohydrolase